MNQHPIIYDLYHIQNFNYSMYLLTIEMQQVLK